MTTLKSLGWPRHTGGLPSKVFGEADWYQCRSCERACKIKGGQCKHCGAAEGVRLRKERGSGYSLATQSHCLHGHPIPEALGVRKDGRHYCRTCRNNWLRKYRRAKCLAE